MDIEAYFRSLVLILAILVGGGTSAISRPDAKVVSIIRQNNGDVFTAEGVECNVDTCVGLSSGTATLAPSDFSTKKHCTCQCHRHLPAYREDLQICVDDIQECVLAPFVSSSTSQQIPFVFLPLKGQIIHPSKEISFKGIQRPVCAVSSAKFLTEGGWIDLRNPIDTDVPFRLFRDEGRTFLQWVGDPELRTRMNGRLVLVNLVCREIDVVEEPSDTQIVFTPCVSFRVVGTPSKYLYNVSEVIFSPDTQSANTNPSSGMTLSEYVAIGVSSVLLGLIYVASVFLYLHLRKRRKDRDKDGQRRNNQTISSAEEGIIKSNPLLGLGRHFSVVDSNYSDSGSSDTDVTPDIISHHEDRKKNIQITSALIHPQDRYDFQYHQMSLGDSFHQDPTNIERLPEENVSIVETLEAREDRPENLRSITGTTRRKLYFNPAYFDPHMLQTPPPAALEFLSKIREVITIAKQKMASKKFTPTLIVIPEEASPTPTDTTEPAPKSSSRRGSMISLKRENSRRKTCSGCPGCEPQDFRKLYGKLPVFPSLGPCGNCTSTTPNENKQITIRKWLEDIPIWKPSPVSLDELNSSRYALNKSLQNLSGSMKLPKRLRSPTRSLPPDAISLPLPSPKYPSTRSNSPSTNSQKTSKGSVSRRKPTKPSCPPPPRPEAIKSKTVPKLEEDSKDLKSYPDMIQEALVVDGKEDNVPSKIEDSFRAMVKEVSKNLDLDVAESIEPSSSPEMEVRRVLDYETDSLERSCLKRGFSTPTDYGEMSSSQPSPSLSAALPLDEEMTMQNAIINRKTGAMTISKLNMDSLKDDNDYELIVLKNNKDSQFENFKKNLLRLPELLQRNDYSLVTEVYVNNGYNYESSPSSPGGSNFSTLERQPKFRYRQNPENPGCLLIEVQDCADNYIKVEESDHFEPDTFDRKIIKAPKKKEAQEIEPPSEIFLRSSGSFKTNSLVSNLADMTEGNFNRNFSSLREIYEAKVRRNSVEALDNKTDDEGKLLTLEERHCRRQRKLNSEGPVQPDVIPPPPHDAPIYEHPKPPRKVLIDKMAKPPLPPKNMFGRSTTVVSDQKELEACHHLKPELKNTSKLISEFTRITHDTVTPAKGKISDYEYYNISEIQSENSLIKPSDLFKNSRNTIICQTAKIPNQTQKLDVINMKNWAKMPHFQGKREDSGYLSTDSNDLSRDYDKETSETDESLGDGHSESGAESVETHSVFFGSYRKTGFISGSVDSGVGCEFKIVKTINVMEDSSSTDSETVSYATIVPLGSSRSVSNCNSPVLD